MQKPLGKHFHQKLGKAKLGTFSVSTPKYHFPIHQLQKYG
jgi:hypothetical protein